MIPREAIGEFLRRPGFVTRIQRLFSSETGEGREECQQKAAPEGAPSANFPSPPLWRKVGGRKASSWEINYVRTEIEGREGKKPTFPANFSPRWNGTPPPLVKYRETHRGFTNQAKWALIPWIDPIFLGGRGWFEFPETSALDDLYLLVV